jgi:oligopeptide/dipeptide ABC transporter ATP-binding protein
MTADRTAELEGSSLRRHWRRWHESPILRAFLRSPGAVRGLIALAIIAGVAIFAPMVLHGRATNTNVTEIYQNPSWQHWLGTDQFGRDILARTLVATRLSVLLGLGAAAISLGIGVLFGITTSVLGPRSRGFALRTIDTLVAFPILITAIFVATIVGIGTKGAVLGVGIAISFAFARIVSVLGLEIAANDFVSAARVSGIGRVRLMSRYVLPNISEPLIIAASVSISGAIVTVAGLSFLGIGVQSPQFDWGGMLTDGVKAIYIAPAGALAPAVAIAFTALSFGLVGESFARAMNPVLWAGTTHRKSRGAKLRSPRSLARGAGGQVAAEASTKALEVNGLTVSFPYGHEMVDVVRNVSFSVDQGEILGIVGESGSGKTMTALAIAQLVPHPGVVQGRVELRGQDLSKLTPSVNKLLANSLAIVFQDPMSSLNPTLKIGRQMTQRVRVHRGLGRRESRELAVARLREVHIPTPEKQLGKRPFQLSGGMRQRVLMAMGLMSEPSLLVADEPTTALDVTIQAQLMDGLEEINTVHKTAIILISHNLALISQNCDRVLVMYAGRIVEELSGEELAADALHPYTRALLGALPPVSAEGRHQLLENIPGEPPDVGSLPAGCAFHTRCPLAVARCETEIPPLVHYEGRRAAACWVVGERVVDVGSAHAAQGRGEDS